MEGLQVVAAFVGLLVFYASIAVLNAFTPGPVVVGYVCDAK